MKNNTLRNIVRYIRRFEVRNAMNISWYSKNNQTFGLRHFVCRRIAKYYYNKHFIKLGGEVKVGKGLYFPHPNNIVIGGSSHIGDYVTVFQNVTLGQNRNQGKYPWIEDYAVIYTGATIIGDVRVGKGAVVGANAVVVKDVPDYAIVAGAPAIKIGERERPIVEGGKPSKVEFPYLEY
ncbi:hypothetical protein [Butyrivibrio sp. MC2013]|uniref:hypothetical protein n=1 Tax=Butyrivibrio sp. MC2013 TaxID=1280686 RepID=UPI0006881F98|nr:hypothetical protein [Butyrivibrio sp. MC2013]